AKGRIFRRQTPDDWAVLNADDPGATALAGRVRGRLLWFSRLRPVSEGAHVVDGRVTLRLDGRDVAVCPLDEIALRGTHNVENVLAATAAAAWAGVPAERLRAAIRDFQACARR